MLQFLRSRQWVIARRLVLVGLILFLGARQYGDSIVSLLRRPNASRDIVITKAEFRPELQGGAKPAWIIGFRNLSDKFTYDDIQLEATYMDEQGKVLEQDKLVVKQKIPPGDEKLIASVDFKSRGEAKQGTLKVTDAQEVK
jgi:hypothetical protein